jgi:hypothetical protein
MILLLTAYSKHGRKSAEEKKLWSRDNSPTPSRIEKRKKERTPKLCNPITAVHLSPMEDRNKNTP